MSVIGSSLSKNYQNVIAAGLAAGFVATGYYFDTKEAVCLGSGYLGSMACNALLSRPNLSGPFEMRKTVFYGRIQPHMPQCVDRILQSVDNRSGWENIALATGTLASGFWGGIYSGVAFGANVFAKKAAKTKPLDSSSLDSKNVAKKNEPIPFVVNDGCDLQKLQEALKVNNLELRVLSRGYFQVVNESFFDACQKQVNAKGNPVILINANQDSNSREKGAELPGFLMPIFADCPLSNDRRLCYYDRANIKRVDAGGKNASIEAQIEVDMIVSAINPNTEYKKALGIKCFMQRLNNYHKTVLEDIACKIPKKSERSILKEDCYGNKYLDYNGIMSFEEFVLELKKLSFPLSEIIYQITANSGFEANPKDLEKLGEAAYKESIKDKIYRQIETAIKTGHDSIIISEWGCGAFGYKPSMAARYYKKVYNTHFKGRIKLVFSVLEPQNLKDFQREFSK